MTTDLDVFAPHFAWDHEDFTVSTSLYEEFFGKPFIEKGMEPAYVPR